MEVPKNEKPSKTLCFQGFLVVPAIGFEPMTLRV
nr:MAG TPA: hypothetical protein [Caudoviricetes sp.]